MNLAVGDFLWVARPVVNNHNNNNVHSHIASPEGTINNSYYRTAYNSSAGNATSRASSSSSSAGGNSNSYYSSSLLQDAVVLLQQGAVVERKAVADLAASILDGRFADQKRRLQLTKARRCIVIVEVREPFVVFARPCVRHHSNVSRYLLRLPWINYCYVFHICSCLLCSV